jgi:DNA-binding LytR/AlgR family response regulator
MKIDWLGKLRHFLQVLAFCLVIATIQYAFMPERPYGPPLVFSLLIGSFTWAIVDLGRELFPSNAETGWPQGWPGVVLVMGGIVGGYLIGTLLANQLCLYYGWYPAGTVSLGEQRTSILITLLAGITGNFYFHSAGKSAYLERKMAEARGHANEARLKLLETQLEPHMLFNTLANLRVLIATDAPRAEKMLDHMIAYLRATLAASRSTTHTLQAEFDRLRDYLELMAVRMGPRLAYTLDLPPDLATQPVPALLLQPLVENAIQHGLEPKVEGGRVSVTARRDGDAVVLEVADTGVGKAEAAGDGKGFGLSQVRERLVTLYGDRGAIAEDEPLLAQALQAELLRAWPQLRIAAVVGDGASAVTQALQLRPDVLFFDIRMPGQSGLEAAAELAEEWPEGEPFPALVFVTAYDQYAVQAFETQAVDYLLKPVQAARLEKTVAKVQDVLARRTQGGQDFEATLGQLRHLLAAAPGPAPAGGLKVIQASVGTTIRMVPVDEVLYFEAADKYVRVLTADHEYLIRTPLKELVPQLDDNTFWQVHRGTVVRAAAIEAVNRDEAGKLHLQLRGRPERLPVSRLYAHLFKAM